MKTIISLTSIPSRFNTLPAIVYDLEKRQDVDEIWVNIPCKYNRFPDVDVVVPNFHTSSKVVINRCVDYGPGTMYMGCLLYTSPSPRDRTRSRMPSSA